MMISLAVCFFSFFKSLFDFWGVVNSAKGQKIAHDIAYDHNFWYTCVKR